MRSLVLAQSTTLAAADPDTYTMVVIGCGVVILAAVVIKMLFKIPASLVLLAGSAVCFSALMSAQFGSDLPFMTIALVLLGLAIVVFLVAQRVKRGK